MKFQKIREMVLAHRKSTPTIPSELAMILKEGQMLRELYSPVVDRELTRWTSENGLAELLKLIAGGTEGRIQIENPQPDEHSAVMMVCTLILMAGRIESLIEAIDANPQLVESHFMEAWNGAVASIELGEDICPGCGGTH